MFNRRLANLLTRTFSHLADSRKREFESKYAHKLHQKLKEKGVLSIDELLKKNNDVAARAEGATDLNVPSKLLGSNTPTPKHTYKSPIKPLYQIMDLKKIMDAPHTPEQVASIWNTYHSIKRDGTGRGYLSASIPAATFSSLIETAKQFPRFIVPLERTSSDDQNTAHEFFFLEWTFHRADDSSEQAMVMFTPLQEYKLRQEFSQPYLVMNCYSELLPTHQIGLMRGEISNSPSRPGEFVLSQNDAQLLAVELQKFYLAKEGQAGRKLLETFHRNKTEFRWEELLRVQ